MGNNSIIVLSCINNVFLYPFIETCVRNNINIEYVLLDGELSLKDQENIRKRLVNGYKIKGLKEFDYIDVPFYFVKDHNSEGVVKKIRGSKSGYIVNAGTPRILKSPIINSKKGILNCHPGLLPDYRGCTCVEWAIYNDDPVGGTVHFISEGIDQGPILIKEKMKIRPNSTYEEIRTDMVTFIADLLVKGVKKCFRENISAKNLPLQKGGTYYKPIPSDKLKIVKSKLRQNKYKV